MVKALNDVAASIRREDYPRALLVLNRLHAARSADPELLGLYGYVNFKLGRFDKAESSIRKALRKRSQDPRLLNLLCNLQMKQDDFEGAKETATRCLRADGGNLEAAFNLGTIAFRLGEYAPAEAQFLDVLRLDPSHADALTYLGLICQRTARYDEALEYYDRALEAAPDSPVALQNKGVVLNRLLRPKRAIDCLQRADARRPDNPTICHNLASAYVLDGDSERALHYFRRAIRLEPLNPEHHHWCNLFLWKENSGEFLDSYHAVLRQTPDAHAIRRELVHKLRMARRYEEADTQLEILIRNEGREPENYRLQGDVLRSRRQFSEALDAHRHAHRLAPGDDRVKEALATSYLSLGEAGKALELIGELTSSGFENQGYWALKAIALRLLRSEEYAYLYDYERLVLRDIIDPPEPFSSLQEFNQELFRELRQHHTARAQPLDQSLLHGTQSLGHLFHGSADITKQLQHALDARMARFLESLPTDSAHPVLARNRGTFSYAGAWSVILESSGHHVNHFHSDGWYSGPYYVQLPDEVTDDANTDGWIKLGEPGFEMAEPLEADCIIRPEEGMLIRFPSYMWHGTFPFDSRRQRAIVGCDIVP